MEIDKIESLMNGKGPKIVISDIRTQAGSNYQIRRGPDLGASYSIELFDSYQCTGDYSISVSDNKLTTDQLMQALDLRAIGTFHPNHLTTFKVINSNATGSTAGGGAVWAGWGNFSNQQYYDMCLVNKSSTNNMALNFRIPGTYLVQVEEMLTPVGTTVDGATLTVSLDAHSGQTLIFEGKKIQYVQYNVDENSSPSFSLKQLIAVATTNVVGGTGFLG